MIVALMMGRAGSRGLKNKNLLKINGKNGHIIWFMNSLTSTSEHETDFFKSSDVVIANENIIFSTQSSMFSYNLENGYMNWDEIWEIENSKIESKCKWSPFDGYEFKGKPVATIVNGVISREEAANAPC